jgi:hypothetical protein
MKFILNYFVSIGTVQDFPRPEKIQSHLKEKFDHTWLSEKSLSFCEVTRIWNVVFIEGFGIYCLL